MIDECGNGGRIVVGVDVVYGVDYDVVRVGVVDIRVCVLWY